VTILVNSLHQDGTKLLSQEKASHQEYIRIPAESYSAKKPEGYNKGNRDMDCQEPLGGEALHICSPIPEWDIQEKNKDGNGNKQVHSYLSKISTILL
jgi:hypothetical protein